MSNVPVTLLGTIQLWFSKLLLNLLLAFLQMAAQAFPGSWGTDPTMTWRGTSAVVTLILLPRCSNESLRAPSDVWLWGMNVLVSWIAEIPDVLMEFITEWSHMLLLEVLCSSKVGEFARPMSESEEKLRQISTWPNPVLKRKLVLKRTGKLNSCDWSKGKKYGYHQLGTTMLVSAAAAGLQ